MRRQLISACCSGHQSARGGSLRRESSNGRWDSAIQARRRRRQPTPTSREWRTSTSRVEKDGSGGRTPSSAMVALKRCSSRKEAEGCFQPCAALTDFNPGDQLPGRHRCV
ncbi:hypothetical protein DAI22_10g060400 [Oryza sativa Japonica Group]|nr:hypothetical protein DAI22_10g060400 [Oryza sativa Japonica Group]